MRPQRLVLTFKPEGVEARVLYRRSEAKGSNPGTKARRREVAELARAGLVEALEALGGEVVSIGEAGFTTREDTFLCATPSDATPPDVHKKRATTKGGA